MNNIIPKHIAIIMDGNGRWAKSKFLPRVFGHRAGIETVRKIVRYVSDEKVSFLTLYAFSTENWSRPSSEVDFLMNLFEVFIQKEKDYLHSHNVIVKFIGIRQGLSKKLIALMDDIEQFTQNNTGLTLVLAINYGGRLEITYAVKSLLEDEKLTSNIPHIDDLQDKLVQKLQCSKFPEPDLLIRTAGDHRISNFLLWHIAYSELYFSDKLWPDFGVDDMSKVLDDYANRERRFGALTS
ncbi:MAG: undecaprenyl diphosphate synthase [Alphaproteobacteria bacterium]|jgi:undecaprenyl diphosphate synthase